MGKDAYVLRVKAAVDKTCANAAKFSTQLSNTRDYVIWDYIVWEKIVAPIF